MTHFRILTLLILFSTCVLSVSLTGRTLADTALPSPTGGPAISGVTYGRQQPVVGAKIYLLAANPAGYGNASLSLLTTAATGNAVDSVGAYATSGAVNDTFNIAEITTAHRAIPLALPPPPAPPHLPAMNSLSLRAWRQRRLRHQQQHRPAGSTRSVQQAPRD
jgi:hypothetical protein